MLKEITFRSLKKCAVLAHSTNKKRHWSDILHSSCSTSLKLAVECTPMLIAMGSNCCKIVSSDWSTEFNLVLISSSESSFICRSFMVCGTVGSGGVGNM